jgi:hypothetical protein
MDEGAHLLAEFGSEILARLERDLSVDPRWVVATRDTRTWWLTDLPQRVWVDPVNSLGGVPWIRAHASTVVSRGTALSPAIYEAIASLNMSAITSALVLDAERSEVFLHCQATFDATRPIGGRYELFRSAVALQAAVSDLLKGQLPSSAGERPRIPHPTSGMHETSTELIATLLPGLQHMSKDIAGISQDDLSAIDQELRTLVLWSIAGADRLSLEVDAGSVTPRIWIAASGGSSVDWDPEAGAAVRESIRQVAMDQNEDPAVFHQILWESLEGPDAPRTGAIRISAADPHPIVGSGVLILLLLPGRLDYPKASRLANALNLEEISANYPFTQLGAWAAREVGTSAQIAYSGFIPAYFTDGQTAENRVAMVSDLAGEVALRAKVAIEYLDDRRMLA